MTKTKSKEVKDVQNSRLYTLFRIIILVSCASVFIADLNPGRVTTAISRNVSLFTASVSYSSIISQMKRALLRGWIQNSTCMQIMIASDLLLIGIILAAVGACMSFGNRRMRKRGFIFPLIGSLLMFGGLGGMFGAYDQIVCRQHNAKVPAYFPYGLLAVCSTCSYDHPDSDRHSDVPVKEEKQCTSWRTEDGNEGEVSSCSCCSFQCLHFDLHLLPICRFGDGAMPSLITRQAVSLLPHLLCRTGSGSRSCSRMKLQEADVLRVLKNTLGMSGWVFSPAGFRWHSLCC
jgi:hypothetical protein